jgi:hypothetical protein
VDTSRTVLVKRQAFEDAVMNLRVPKETLNFFFTISEELVFNRFLFRSN